MNLVCITSVRIFIFVYVSYNKSVMDPNLFSPYACLGIRTHARPYDNVNKPPRVAIPRVRDTRKSCPAVVIIASDYRPLEVTHFTDDL